MWIVYYLTGEAGYSIRGSEIKWALRGGSEIKWALRGGTLRLCDNSEGVKCVVELGYFSPIKCLVWRVKTVDGVVID